MKNNAKLVRLILLVVFFLSGASALIYQVIWIRMLGQVFGLTIFAVSTVLTAFMAGLALGNYVFGKIIDKRQNQLFIFLLLELGIGLFALLFPVLLELMKSVYTSLTLALQPDLYLNSIIRFAVAFLLLLVPTTLMGGTLPVLSKYYVKNLQQLGGSVGTLSAVNNLGAFCGAGLASFFLIQIAGLAGNIYIAAVINLLIAAVIFFINKTVPAADVPGEELPRPKPAAKTRPAETYPRSVLRLVLWAFAIEGFTTLVYEVVWTRILLGISYDKSVYFFTTVIMAFIFGLALGSLLVARFVDRKNNLVFLLGALELVIGISACAVLLCFSQIAGYFSAARLQYADPWLFSLGKEYLIFFLLMALPATLMGMTFPIVAKIYTTNFQQLGHKLGLIGCLDTIGSIFGSFAAGFILIPFIGVVKTVLLTAGINIALGLLLVMVNPRSSLKVKAGSAVVTVCAALVMLLFMPQEKYFRHWQTEEEGDRLLFYREGLGSTVAVAQKFDGVKELAIDGAVTAIAEYGDIRVHKLLAYLPYLLAEQPSSALVVGFGMGITAQSLIQDDIREVTCVEICDEVIDGSALYFAKENKNVLSEPKLKVVIEDGRSYLAVTGDTYDIITTNAVHPRLSINIYTKEFYELCKSRLTADGVMCQWMTTNWLSAFEYKMLLKSFIDVFPETSLWISNIGHVLLLGTPGPLKIDVRQLARKMSREKVKSDLQEVHLDDPLAFLALYSCGKEEILRYTASVPPASDNYPLPEFSRYISTFPNLEITEEFFVHRRDLASLITHWATEHDERKIRDYLEAERRFLRARHDTFLSDGSRIADNLEKAIRLNPANFSFYHTLGDFYAGRGAFEEAIAAYKQEIELGKDNPLGYINLAYAYLKMGKYDEVLPPVTRILELDPENGLAHYLHSIVLRVKQDFAAAAEALEAVICHFPSFTSAYLELSDLYFVTQRWPEAKTTLVRYLEEGGEAQNAEELQRELKKLGY